MKRMLLQHDGAGQVEGIEGVAQASRSAAASVDVRTQPGDVGLQ